MKLKHKENEKEKTVSKKIGGWEYHLRRVGSFNSGEKYCKGIQEHEEIHPKREV